MFTIVRMIFIFTDSMKSLWRYNDVNYCSYFLVRQINLDLHVQS